MGGVRFVGYRREPVEQVGPRSGVVRWLLGIPRVEEELDAGPIKPVATVFDPEETGHARSRAELLHNRALEAGFESELVYFEDPVRFRVRVRKPGSKEPGFDSDAEDIQRNFCLDS